MTWSARARVHPPYAARTFLAVARPTAAHYRVYLVDSTLLVREWRAEEPAPGSSEPGGAPLERLVEIDPETGKLSLHTFAEPWLVTLRNAQRRWMRKRLASAGLPLPRGLDPAKD